MAKSGAKREESRVANTHKSTEVEELNPVVLTSDGTGGARPYGPRVPLGTAFARSNGVTFVKAPIYFETPAAAQRAAIIRLHQKHT
jgi:hypothetical protein